jgi:hypothetical protein
MTAWLPRGSASVTGSGAPSVAGTRFAADDLDSEWCRSMRAHEFSVDEALQEAVADRLVGE